MTEPRDQALAALYEREASPGPFSDDLGPRAQGLVDGVLDNRVHLDELIEDASRGWRIPRMPVVDRNILRLATYELEQRPELPTAVILSEAVRLAKTYSTSKSASFVNGVLSTIAGRVRET